jgi:hypothetical protein
MSSVHAKLFEWHRMNLEIERAERELNSERWPETEREARRAEASIRLQALRENADSLLHEIDRLRHGE